jgi:two-component system response regulator NreC
MRPIRLLLVDDHEVVRTGLKSYLQTQPGLEVVAEASNGSEAIARALEVRPDIILMDITMPGMDGLEATRQLKAMWPEAVILALTIHEDKFYFMEMLAAGASGYLTKQAAADELVQAIRTVATGSVYLQPALARWLLEDYQRLAGQDASAPRPQKAWMAGSGARGAQRA